VAAHELGHNLGAVNNSAPNSSNAGHCVDEYDVMCYRDADGTRLRTVCPDRAHDQRLDCEHDDYYHTDPSPGSYLATHWNVADSQFLVHGGDAGGTAGPSPSAPTPTPTASATSQPSTPTASASPSGGTGPTAPPERTTSPSASPTTSPTVSPTVSLKPLRVSATTSNAARLSWDAAAVGTRYGVVVDGRTVGWTGAAGVRLIGLRAGTTYRVQVVVGAESAARPYTEAVSVRTAAVAQPTAGAWFALGNTLTGAAAELYGARTAGRTPVVLGPATGSASQAWRLEAAGEGTYRLRSRATGRCVAPLDGVAGAPLVQRTCTSRAPGQLWRLGRAADGFTLATARGGLVVGLAQERFAGQRLLVLQRPQRARHQTWVAVPA
jgi:hypothetical protein